MVSAMADGGPSRKRPAPSSSPKLEVDVLRHAEAWRPALNDALLKRATKRASVGSLAGAFVGAIVATRVTSGPFVWMAWAIAVLIVLRHLDNIQRLIAGTEPES